MLPKTITFVMETSLRWQNQSQRRKAARWIDGILKVGSWRLAPPATTLDQITWRRQLPYISHIGMCHRKVGADLGGGCRGCATPPSPEMTCGFLIQLVFCEKKTMWFIGVEVEQETSTPRPKKNPGSAPAKGRVFAPFWSEKGYRVYPFWSGTRVWFKEGSIRERMNVLVVSVPKE